MAVIKLSLFDKLLTNSKKIIKKLDNLRLVYYFCVFKAHIKMTEHNPFINDEKPEFSANRRMGIGFAILFVFGGASFIFWLIIELIKLFK